MKAARSVITRSVLLEKTAFCKGAKEAMQDLSLEQAQKILLENLPLLETETVALSAGLNRILARQMTASQSLPAAEQSAVDGYAVGSSTSAVPSNFRVAGSYQLEECPNYPLQSNEAVRVKTGGVLPPGTCAVVPHEKTFCKADLLLVYEKVKTGQNIKSQGEDFRQGEVILNGSTRLTASGIALLSAMGVDAVEVYRRPRIATINLAPNVVPAPLPITMGQTWDSNGPMLSALVQQDGGVAVVAEPVVVSELPQRLPELLNTVDLLICTGGSYTENDSEARSLFTDIGAKVLYWDVAIQPGSHTGAAKMDSQLLFSLSGNPAACFVGYQLFVAPVIKAMFGQTGQNRAQARCINGFNKPANTRRMVRGRALYSDNGWEVTVLPGQKPSMIRSLLDCNALIDIAAGSPALEPGSSVQLILL